MTSAAATAVKPPRLSLLTPPPPKSSNPNLPRNLHNSNPSKRSISIRSVQISDHIPKLQPPPPELQVPTTSNIADKIKILVSEFKSLPEPVDRVKRLIHYASLLPDFEESGQVESNRVKGCTAQVWLQAAMDSGEVMRFRVYSDSEITKGFCYCLIWLLDGAKAEEVMEVKVEELGEMNVGVFPIRVNSRVHTWHNVLFSMQRRTQALIMEERYPI